MEKRSSQRHEDQFLISLVHEASGEKTTCKLIDISTGGLAVENPGTVEIVAGDFIIVEIPLGQSISRINTRCLTCNVTGTSVQTVRLQFLDDSSLMQETIHNAIDVWSSRKVDHDADS